MMNPIPSPSHSAALPRLGLGIDTGGTQTRWAIATIDEKIVASGTTAGLTALQLNTLHGQTEFGQVFAGLAATAHAHGSLQSVRAGITGFGDQAHHALLQRMLTDILHLPPQAIHLSNDIEIAYLDNFQPGTGYLIYAGTGSIAALIDETGQFHRAGGRGYLLDDGGSGFWIAREALRHIWRSEDEEPGWSQHSRLAQEMFKALGGDSWDVSKNFIYHRSRGEIGTLALAVAAAAGHDETAARILKQAGAELARLGLAMCRRFGDKPMVLSGRVQELHPLIADSLRQHLPPHISLRRSVCQAHFSAARLAARQLRTL
ncbi:N-acetylglucosamine kinase [Undibacterium griseum]|nr:BadF/BadG/BcrA/BcrD ATPase family protein [Undibacterium griseum]